ncbi:protein of unknown function [Pseudomonas sp. JV551A1]|nr:protein of unknown function [Pseudomonas sp. JV551A1]
MDFDAQWPWELGNEPKTPRLFTYQSDQSRGKENQAPIRDQTLRALELAAKKFGYLNFYSATRAPDPDYGSWHGRPALTVVRNELTGEFAFATLSARRQMR